MVKYSTERTDALLMKLRKGDFYWIVKRLIKNCGRFREIATIVITKNYKREHESDGTI